MLYIIFIIALSLVFAIFAFGYIYGSSKYYNEKHFLIQQNIDLVNENTDLSNKVNILEIRNQNLKYDKEDYMKEAENLERKCRYYKSKSDYYKDRAESFSRLYFNSNNFNHKDIIDDKELKIAIKKLMIYSHPDKKLCKDSSDFIKYKEIYDKLK